MAQSGKTSRITISTQIELSLVESGLNHAQIHELERRLQRMSGIRSTKSTEQSIVLYPLSTQYVLNIQTEAMNIVQNYYQLTLDGQHVIVGRNN